MDDRRKLELLAGDLLSYLPQPRQSSDLLAETSGLAAGRRVPCEMCGARGRVANVGGRIVPCASCLPRVGPKGPPVGRPGHGCSGCPGCEATGWRKAKAGDDEWDEYAGERVDRAREREQTQAELLLELAQGFGRKRESEAREAALRRVEAQQARERFERGETTQAGDEGWLKQQRWMQRNGSYRELELALESLRGDFPERVRLWWRVFVLEEEIEMSQLVRMVVNETTDMLAARMPKPIKVPARLEDEEEANRLKKDSLWRGQTERHREQRHQRDMHIVELFTAEGWKKSRIARFYGLDRSMIVKILQRHVGATSGQP